jgi:SAM-dependent methyltransferase
MDYLETIIRRMEDFILAQRGLESVGDIEFEHAGKREQGYPYIRAANRPLANALAEVVSIVAKPVDAIRFLEVGCGIGTKCEIARLMGMKAFGIDILPAYIDLAQQLYPECRFTQANALAYDYTPFDAVYYHVPFFEDDLVRQLENRVLSQLPFGAVMIVTRASRALARTLEHEPAAPDGCSVHRLTVRQDVGRLILMKKC